MTVYKVTAGTYLGHQLGEEFEADLTPDEERRAKERGSIRVVKRDDKSKTEKEADGDG